MESTRTIESVACISNDNSDVYCVRWNSDDSQLACARASGYISIYNSNYELKQSLDCKIQHSLPICSIRWRPEKGLTKNVLLAATSEGAVMHWHSSSGKLIYSTLLEDNQALCCDYHPEAEYFAVGCKDMSVRIFDENTKQVISELKKKGDTPGHSNRIFAIKWPDPHTLYSAGWDNNILMWDTRTRIVSKFFNGHYICGDSIDVFEDTLLCTDCKMTDQVTIWSVSQGTIIHSETIVNDGKPFKGYTAQFSKVDRAELFFIGGSGSTQGYFYYNQGFNTIAALSYLPKSIFSCDFGNSTQKFATGCANGTVNIFNIDRKINNK